MNNVKRKKLFLVSFPTNSFISWPCMWDKEVPRRNRLKESDQGVM